MGMLLAILPIWNLALLLLASNFICFNWYYWVLYFFALNLVAHGFHRFVTSYRKLKKSSALNAQNLKDIVIQRNALLELLKENGL